MSNAMALAAVTAVLKDLLINGVIDGDLTAHTGEITVSSLPPDRVLTGPNDPTRLNLFLYSILPNQGWRNVGLPSHDSGGTRISNPPLALDLYYMLTAYGSQELQAEMLLGRGMQILHETPVLPRQSIRDSLSHLTGSLTTIAASELADQVEQIKITHHALSMEDVSRLWGTFEMTYRPSVYYCVTAVLIESRRSVKTGPPVRQSNLLVMPLKFASIERVISSHGEDVFIEAGDTLVIEGQRLRGDITRVKIDGQELTPAAGDVSDQAVNVPVPLGLTAGLHGAQIVHPIDFQTGSAAEPHRGFESNTAAFVLHPHIAALAVTNPSSRVVPQVDPITGATQNVTFHSGTLNVTVSPSVSKDQRVVVMLNEMTTNPAAVPHAYSFQLPLRTSFAAVSILPIPFSDVFPGDYLVRLQVDGAESALTVDGSGQYNGPKVTI